MNKNKTLIFVTLLILLIPVYCTVYQKKQLTLSREYNGIWLLNREKTIEKMLEKKGQSFTSLSTEEQSHMIETFPFDIIVEFDSFGNWRGSFLDKDGTMNNGGGSYTAIKKEKHSYQISVEEKSGEGSFADSFLINVASGREIHIILGGTGTIDLILQRTKEFLPINERQKMVSPDSKDI